MQVKNKIIEQLDASARADFYTMLQDESILICKAKADIPNMDNIEKCGDGFLVFNPTAEQQPYCCGRVMSLYDFFPDMRDDAEYWCDRTKEEFTKANAIAGEQYDLEEVYSFFQHGIYNGTLWNIMDDFTVQEFVDDENDRKIEIAEVYVKGEWNSYVCSVSGIKERHNCGISYDEHDLKAALKHFPKFLKGADKRAYEKFMQCEAEM